MEIIGVPRGYRMASAGARLRSGCQQWRCGAPAVSASPCRARDTSRRGEGKADRRLRTEVMQFPRRRCTAGVNCREMETNAWEVGMSDSSGARDDGRDSPTDAAGRCRANGDADFNRNRHPPRRTAKPGLLEPTRTGLDGIHGVGHSTTSSRLEARESSASAGCARGRAWRA